MPTTSEDLLSIGEAARETGVSVDTLRRYATDGRIAAVLTPGGHRRFRRSDLEALLAPVEPTETVEQAS